MQADDEKDDSHEVIAVPADVAHHSAQSGGNGPDRADCNENADCEKCRYDEGPPGRHLSLLADKADDKRNARQVTRA